MLFYRLERLLPPAADPTPDIAPNGLEGLDRRDDDLYTAVLADSVLILMTVCLDGFGLGLAAVLTGVSLHAILRTGSMATSFVVPSS